VARLWHQLTFLVALSALGLQTWLVLTGEAVLVETTPPSLGIRLMRLVGYFTIQSNVLVAVATGLLALRPDRSGVRFEVVRLAAVVGITITGIVHWFALRPLLDLEGANVVADKLLHLVVPALAVVGWLVFGPRPRIELRTIGLALVWPVTWLVVILGQGAGTGWYPYPFLDVDENGWGHVLVASAIVTALMLACFFGAREVDRRLPPAP